MRRRRLLPLIVAATALLGACGGGNPQPLALVASSPASMQVGEQRVLIGLVDPETQSFLASPDLAATATFTGPDDHTIDAVPLDFIWAVPDARGLYRAVVTFPVAGGWSVRVQADGYPFTEPTPIMISEEAAMPQVGEPAPAVATRTTAEHELGSITTDPDPDPDLYVLSVDDALADDRPTVIVFATPAFCTSATCGPVLETVKRMTGDHPGVDFIHVEIYENLDADSFEDLVTVEAVDVWSLPSEPWVFVTDPAGVVTARFEGTLDAEELEAALSALGS